jgi:hypothetical protein
MENKMNQEITNKLTLFAENVQVIAKDFIWDHIQTKRLAALLYALEDKVIDCDAIRKSHNLIKEKKGLFSMFGGNMSLFIAAMLSLDDGYQGRLDDVSQVYDLLKAEKFRASDYLVVAAYLIVANTDEGNYQRTVLRARLFYEGMKQNNRWRIGQDDYVFAVMLGLSDIDDITGVSRVHELYERLKPEFKKASANSVQSLAHVLTLGGKPDEALGQLLLLRDSLQSRKVNLDRTYTLPALGAISLLPIDGNILVEDLRQAHSFLRGKKGLGSFSITSQELLLFISALISSVYAKESDDDLVNSTPFSVVNIIVAHQVYVAMAVIAATDSAVT